MLNKFLYYLLFLLIFPANYFFLIKSAESQINQNKLQPIDINYLKRLPDYEYILGPGDTIKIVVSREYPELTTASTIDGEGTIYVPKLRKVYIKDLSVDELTNLLNDAFKQYVKYPLVEIKMMNYRPIKVLVQGEVERPGLINLRGSLSYKTSSNLLDIEFQSMIDDDNNLITDTALSDPSSKEESINYYFPTIFDAIRQSGGITPYSNLEKVQIIRKSNLTSGFNQTTKTVNFEKVLDGDNSQNVRIYDSDIIKIPKSNQKNNSTFSKATVAEINPRYSNVFVFGRVNNPGKIKVSRAGVLSDAIEISGVKVIRGPIRFIRFNYDGTIDKRKFRFNPNTKRGTFKNPLLKDGDLIVVGQGPLSTTTEVVNEITSPFIGIFSTYSLIKSIQD